MGELRCRWSTAQAQIHRLIGACVTIKADEVPAVLCSFFTLFSILASYFLLLPLREDAGISLGTSTLPLLFMCSLVVTLLFTPAASAFLSRSRPRSRETALKQFYCFMAFVLLVFYFLYNFSAAERLIQRAAAYAEPPHYWQQRTLLAKHPALEQHAAGHTTYAQHGIQQQMQEGDVQVSTWPAALSTQLLPSVAVADVPVEVTGSVSVHSTLQVQPPPAHYNSLEQTSARDSASPGVIFTGRRLQHEHTNVIDSGSSGGAVVESTTHSQASDAGSVSSAHSNIRSSRGKSSASPRQYVSSQYGDPTLSGSQRTLRAAFYVWVNVMNLVGISSLWARCADAFSPDAGARLFGFISAGATLGQLAGSLLALAVTWAAEAVAAQQLLGQQQHAAKIAGSGGTTVWADGSGQDSTQPVVDASVPASGLILVAALLQLVAAHLVCRVRPPCSSTAAVGAVVQTGVKTDANRAGSDQTANWDDNQPHADGTLHSSINITAVRRTSGAGKLSSTGGVLEALVNTGSPTRGNSSTSSTANGNAGGLRRRAGTRLHGMLSGFRLVLSSRYLLMLCGNLLMTYVVGSLMYFQRALVVSTSVKGPSYRAAFFATLNTWSAAGILIMQLCATSSMLRYLGMSAALGLGPAICLLGTLSVTLLPCPAMVAGFEVIRKLIGYAVHRPAREVLFTVVSREEKYCAKLVIDTVVQRLGDAMAAAAFQILDVRFQLGQAGVGAAGCLMCIVWLAMAHKLGQQHEQMVVQALAAEARAKLAHQV